MLFWTITLILLLIATIWLGLQHPTTRPSLLKGIDILIGIIVGIATVVTDFVETYITIPTEVKRTIRIKHNETIQNQTTTPTATEHENVELETYEYVKKEEHSMRMIPSKHPTIVLPPLKNKFEQDTWLQQKVKQWKQREENMGKLSQILKEHYEKPLQMIRTFSTPSNSNSHSSLTVEVEEVEETQEMIGKQKPVMESIKQLIDTCKQDSLCHQKFSMLLLSFNIDSYTKELASYLTKYFIPYLQLYKKCIPPFHDCLLQVNRKSQQIRYSVKLMDSYKNLMSLLDQYCEHAWNDTLNLNSILFYPIQNMFITMHEFMEWNQCKSFTTVQTVISLLQQQCYELMKECFQIYKCYQVKKHVHFYHQEEQMLFLKQSTLHKVKFNKQIQQELLQQKHISQRELLQQMSNLTSLKVWDAYLLDTCLCLVDSSKRKVISMLEGTQVKPFQMNHVKYGFVIQTLHKQHFFKVENALEQKLWINIIQQYCLSKFDLNFELLIQPKPQIKLDDPQAYYPIDLKTMFESQSEYLKYQKELPETSDYIEYMDDQIICATVEKLIEKLTSMDMMTSTNSIDRATPYQISFLMTYRSFISPKQLLHELQLRYFMPPPQFHMTTEEFKAFKFAKLFPTRLAVIQILKYWIAKHSHDFTNKSSTDTEALLQELNQFILNIGKSSERFMQNVGNQLHDALEHAIQTENQVLEKKKNSLKPSMWNQFFSNRKLSLLLDYPTKEIAKQLTQLECNYFVAILPRECLNQNWNKKGQQMTLAPNITALIQRTNTTVHLLSWNILQYTNLQERVNALSKVIKLAKELQCLQNYHGCFEVVGALNSIAVHRLKQTWAFVSKELLEDFKQLEQFVSPLKNFKAMRQAVKSNVPPLLPYLGIFLTDFTFIDESNGDVLHDKINFYKNTKMSSVIQELQLLQKVQYQYPVIPEIEELLCKKEEITEDALIEMSMKLEKKQ